CITNEISQLDVTLSATLLERAASSSSVNKDEQHLSPGETVYAYLCYEKDGVEKQRFAMTKPHVIVGRTDPKRGVIPDIDLTPLDPKMTVSRKHVRIRFEETFFYMEDLKSHNSTRLGGERLKELEPQLVQDGDIVQIGAVLLVFRVPSSSLS
ncbi:MAG: FHA domain-containing protein, partial [Chloroflexota bacterium]|nr:FHA domain-containing protein [Chloroflexota bacterium]